jgi:prepilin-type processing-associated H-X9-DG protein
MKRVLPVSEFRDGLAHTLAFSEKPIGTGASGPYSSFRDWLMEGMNTASAAEWSVLCAGLTEVRRPQLDAGMTWVLPGGASTDFFAIEPPGSRVPDCGEPSNFGTGVFTPRSYHGDGVNAAMADGSVRWFGGATSVAVWRALGTRAGGEVVSP